MNKTILRITDVQKYLGLSRSTIYLFIKKGNFPTKIQLGERSVGFLSTDIDAWLDGRIEASKGSLQ